MTAALDFYPHDPAQEGTSSSWYDARPVAHFGFGITCPQCGSVLDLRGTDSPTERVRRASLACEPCRAYWRVTVTLVRTWLTPPRPGVRA